MLVILTVLLVAATGRRPGRTAARYLSGPACRLGLLASLLLGPLAAQAQTPASGVVTYVADGDTVYVRLSEHTPAVPVRLLGIDAPEICQEGGQAARQALQALLQDQPVTFLRQQTDSYGRELATVYWQGQDVARAMVAQGMAWSYRFGRDPGPYAREQQIARAAGLGLFARPDPEPPHRFRQRHGSCKSPP